MSIKNMILGAGVNTQTKAHDPVAAAEGQAATLLNVKREIAAAPFLAASYGHPGAKPEDFVNVAATPAKPARPGDTPARAFVGKTLTQLHQTYESYRVERELLNKDIQKLQEEHSQISASIDALQAAINALSAHEPEVAIDQTALEHELNGVGKE